MYIGLRGGSPIEKIVIHTNEGPEYGWNSAEDLRGFLNTIDGGYHKIVDNNSVVTAAPDWCVVHGAAYMNNWGLHVCLIGYASQSTAGWSDPFSQAELKIAASVVAAWCKQYGIPARHLSTAEVRTMGVKGLCGHVDVTNAYGGANAGHWDPGPNFPWNTFISLVVQQLTGQKPPAEQPGVTMDVFTDEVHAGLNAARPRTASIAPNGIIFLGNKAKVSGVGGTAPKLWPNKTNLYYIDPKYAPGEAFHGAKKQGNGFLMISLLPNGEFATRKATFVA